MKILRTVTIPDSTKQSNTYKTMKFVFQTLHILFCVNLGFFAHKPSKFRLALNLFTFVQCVTLCVTLFVILNGEGNSIVSFWCVVYIIKFLLTVIILSFFKPGTTFCNLYLDLKHIDAKLQVNAFCNMELKVVLSIFFCLVERFVITTFYCTVSGCFEPLWFSFIFLFINLSVDISLICYAFVFYSIYCRLRELSSILETDHVDSDQYLYKTIIDTMEKYKTAFDPVYIVLLLLNVPQVMATIFYTLREMQDRTHTIYLWSISLEYVQAFEVLLLTIAPALTADMITTQAEKIKSILHDKLLLQDINQTNKIRRFIKYVEARPCRLHVCKVIPLSADLLGMVLSFCVTYLIVIIQFTHTY